MVIGSNGSATCAPKGSNTLEGKLPIEKIMLWHIRFGHIGEKSLRTLKNKNLVEGFNFLLSLRRLNRKTMLGLMMRRALVALIVQKKKKKRKNNLNLSP